MIDLNNTINIDKNTADKIINSLECGVVPVNAVHFFNAGREKEIKLIDKKLTETESGKSELIFIHGDYGTGKTHLLDFTVTRALKRKFLASHISLTSRECPLSHLNLIYRNILKNLRFENQQHKSGLYSFLDLWLSFTTKKILQHKNEKCKHDATFETCALGCINELYFKYIPELREVHSDFRNATKLYQYANFRNNAKLRDLIIRWLLGEQLNRTDLKWINLQLRGVQITSNICDDSTFLTLQDISQVSKILGFSGLLILLDEAERIPSINKVIDGYYNLIRLIITSLDLPGVMFIYATTPQFYDDAGRYLELFKPKVNDIIEQVERRMENERIKLAQLSPTKLEKIAGTIFRIYLISIGAKNSYNDLLSRWESNFHSIKDECRKQENMRNFVTMVLRNIKMIDS